MALSTVFQFHKFSRQLSAFSLCSSNLNSASLVLSTIYRFMKVSLSPDIILCGGLGLRHQLTTLPCPRTANRHLILVLTASRDDGEFCIWGTAPGQRSTGHNAPINQTYFCTCKGHTFYRDTKVRWRLISVDIFFLHSQGKTWQRKGWVFVRLGMFFIRRRCKTSWWHYRPLNVCISLPNSSVDKHAPFNPTCI